MLEDVRYRRAGTNERVQTQVAYLLRNAFAQEPRQPAASTDMMLNFRISEWAAMGLATEYFTCHRTPAAASLHLKWASRIPGASQDEFAQEEYGS